MTHLQQILASWFAIAFVLTGLGALVQRAWRRPVAGADGWLRCFWLGWSALLLLLQFWHFVLPIEDRALWAVSAAGILGVALEGRRPWTTLLRGALRHLPALVLVGLTAAWFADRATGGNANGDTGYYFFPTMAWLRAYPIVPGLANLSAPLAFNQTYFHYAALLESGRFGVTSNHLANGVLLLALVARGLLGASRTFRRGGGDPVEVFYLCFVPVAVTMVFHPNYTSPAPDFAVFVFGVVLAGEFIALLTRPGRLADSLFALTVLATSAITVKLSLAPLAATTLLVASAVALWRRVGVRAFVGAVALGLVWMVPWMAGNVVMSGFPLYPSGFGAMPVAWRVPLDVSGLIRESSSLHGSLDLIWRDPKWVLTSLDSLGWNTREVLLPLGMTAAAIVAGPLLWLIRRRSDRRPGVPMLALVPTILALVIWFLMAPRPRFAGAAFWLLGIEAVLVAFAGWIATRTGRGMIAALALALTALALHGGGPFLQPLPTFGPWPKPVLHEKTLASGLVVAEPTNSSCWDALLCTPMLSPGLMLLVPGDPGGGFRIDPSIPQAATTPGVLP